MAYFECTIGGASGDGVALIVQCDANFAGSTITADNGEDVFTEICPSVSPYTVKYEGIPIGTYTISGEAEGQTFTTQFTVLDYYTELNSTPEGATVTPTDDIQTWLHCASIWDKNYTSVAEVLADASTLQALIASNNAVDYMARSTTWASNIASDSNAMTYIGANDYCANQLLSDSTWRTAICNSTYFESVLNVKVPTMTSNTAPSGEAFAKNPQTSGDMPYRAFDGNDDTSAQYATGGTGASTDNGYIGYEFTSNVKIYLAKFKNHQLYWHEFYKVQSSSDNSSYTDRSSEITVSTAGNWHTINVNPVVACKYWRLYGRRNLGGATTYIKTVQFYGRA